MTAPLYDSLKKISSQYPYYMPGHKRKEFPYLKDLISLDFTEISDTDNLHYPTSHILHSQELMAILCGSEESHFLVNGTTCGILSAIYAICSRGDKILIARNCHISVYNAITLLGLIPVYIYPEITDYGIAGGISPSAVKKAVTENLDIKACIITSPTYEGFCSDIKEITNILHKYSIPIIVDEAHGATFGLCRFFPVSAVSARADIVIQSWHKTLPVLTQTSVAHIQGKLVDREKFKKYLRIFQSTSPSFIFMAVLDKCREFIEKEGFDYFYNLKQSIQDLRKRLAPLKTLKLIDSSVIGLWGIYDMDWSRLSFMINSDITGSELDDIFNDKYNIRFEMCGIRHIIAITTIADNKEDIDRLASAIINQDKSLQYKEVKPLILSYPRTKMVLTPAEADMANTDTIPFLKSEGMVSAEFITPYPPGIPLITPGEIITQEIIALAKQYYESSIPINGIESQELKYIRVVK